MASRIAILVAGLLLPLGNARPAIVQGAKPKKTALEGTWQAVDKKSAVRQMKFAEYTFEATIDGKTWKGTFRLNNDENPMHIDLRIAASSVDKFKGKTALGIYEFRGEKVRWCSSQPGRKRRPGQFDTKMGDARLLLATLKKQKVK